MLIKRSCNVLCIRLYFLSIIRFVRQSKGSIFHSPKTNNVHMHAHKLKKQYMYYFIRSTQDFFPSDTFSDNFKIKTTNFMPR